MHKLKSRGIIVLTIIGLFALSGIALADGHDPIEPGDDTLLNLGADEQFLFWNVTSFEYDDAQETVDTCALTGRTFEYVIDGDDLTLTETDPDPTLTETDPDPEADLSECADVLFADVTGPNGQVNHGMFMKTFNEWYSEMYEGEAKRGCLVRHLAHQDFGKNVSQQEEGNGGAEPAIFEGTVDFTSIVDDCIKDDNGGGNGGPPQHVLDKHAQKWSEGKPGKGPKTSD